MISIADFLDAKRKEIDERLRELRPLIEEYHRLEAAAAALAGVDPGRAQRSPSRASAPSAAKNGRRRSRRNTRADQALELVKAKPGISIAEIARRTDINQNYLYRVLPQLLERGLVKKSGRSWHPV